MEFHVHTGTRSGVKVVPGARKAGSGKTILVDSQGRNDNNRRSRIG